MEKTITMARREFINSMNKLLAESRLPYCMLADIFKDAVIQLQQLDNEQYEIDKRAYEEELRSKHESDAE